MPWPEIALSQGEKKQRRIKESGDEAILTAGNCLICHVALSVAKKKKKKKVGGIAQLRLALGQFKTNIYNLQIQKNLTVDMCTSYSGDQSKICLNDSFVPAYD